MTKAELIAALDGIDDEAEVFVLLPELSVSQRVTAEGCTAEITWQLGGFVAEATEAQPLYRVPWEDEAGLDMQLYPTDHIAPDACKAGVGYVGDEEVPIRPAVVILGVDAEQAKTLGKAFA